MDKQQSQISPTLDNFRQCCWTTLNVTWNKYLVPICTGRVKSKKVNCLHLLQTSAKLRHYFGHFGELYKPRIMSFERPFQSSRNSMGNDGGFFSLTKMIYFQNLVCGGEDIFHTLQVLKINHFWVFIDAILKSENFPHCSKIEIALLFDQLTFKVFYIFGQK